MRNGRFGLTEREATFLARLSPPWRIQRYLDSIEYDFHHDACRSPRHVLADRKAQCLDGAIFAAAALRLQGHPPLLVDLEAVQDDDHVLAVYRIRGCWGALGRSNYSGLRYREPIYPTLHHLVLSYFESYFNLRRQKTLRAYSRPVNLARFDRRRWMTSEENLWWVAEHLLRIPHRTLLTSAQLRDLSTVDKRMFRAGLVGREEGRGGRVAD